MRKSRRASLAALLLALAGVLVLAAPGGAGGGGRERNRGGGDDGGNRIVLNGRVDVVEGDTVENVVVFNGPAAIAGEVKRNVVAVNGNIRVSGRVGDNVIALNGHAIILDGAVVGGDVRSSDKPIVSRGARVDGDIEETNFVNAFDVLGIVLYILWWLAVTISLFVLGVLLLWLAPRVADAAVTAARTRIGPSIGWGFALTFGVPIVSIVVLFTLLGAPLGLVGLLGLAPLFALGYVVSAYLVGRLILRDSNRFLVFLLGWAILRFVELFPLLGHLVTFAAIVYGVGALTVAAWRAAHPEGAPARGAAAAAGRA